MKSATAMEPTKQAGFILFNDSDGALKPDETTSFFLPLGFNRFKYYLRVCRYDASSVVIAISHENIDEVTIYGASSNGLKTIASYDVAYPPINLQMTRSEDTVYTFAYDGKKSHLTSIKDIHDKIILKGPVGIDSKKFARYTVASSTSNGNLAFVDPYHGTYSLFSIGTDLEFTELIQGSFKPDGYASEYLLHRSGGVALIAGVDGINNKRKRVAIQELNITREGCESNSLCLAQKDGKPQFGSKDGTPNVTSAAIIGNTMIIMADVHVPYIATSGMGRRRKQLTYPKALMVDLREKEQEKEYMFAASCNPFGSYYISGAFVFLDYDNYGFESCYVGINNIFNESQVEVTFGVKGLKPAVTRLLFIAHYKETNQCLLHRLPFDVLKLIMSYLRLKPTSYVFCPCSNPCTLFAHCVLWHVFYV